jgi:hypothetical protein
MPFWKVPFPWTSLKKYLRLNWFFMAECQATLHLRMKHINHKSSLRFSIRMIGDEDAYNNQQHSGDLSEHLTVAYF